MLVIQSITELYKKSIISQFGGPESGGGDIPTTSTGEDTSGKIDFDSMDNKSQAIKNTISRMEQGDVESIPGVEDFDSAYELGEEGSDSGEIIGFDSGEIKGGQTTGGPDGSEAGNPAGLRSDSGEIIGFDSGEIKGGQTTGGPDSSEAGNSVGI